MGQPDVVMVAVIFGIAGLVSGYVLGFVSGRLAHGIRDDSPPSNISEAERRVRTAQLK